MSLLWVSSPFRLAVNLGLSAGASLGAKIVKAEETVVKWLGLALLSQGGISIGLSMIVARELPGFADKIITVILFFVLVFKILGPILAKVSISKAGEVDGLKRKVMKEKKSMKALFLVLNKTEKLNDILEKFMEVGVTGATILDSQGMGSALIEGEIPLFGGVLRSVMDNNRPYNKTIFTLVNDEDMRAAKAAVKEVLGEMDQPGVGQMFSVDVGDVVGI